MNLSEETEAAMKLRRRHGEGEGVRHTPVKLGTGAFVSGQETVLKFFDPGCGRSTVEITHRHLTLKAREHLADVDVHGGHRPFIEGRPEIRTRINDHNLVRVRSADEYIRELKSPWRVDFGSTDILISPEV